MSINFAIKGNLFESVFSNKKSISNKLKDKKVTKITRV